MYDVRTTFSCGKQRVIQRGEESQILPDRITNHSAGFGSVSTRGTSYVMVELAIFNRFKTAKDPGADKPKRLMPVGCSCVLVE